MIEIDCGLPDSYREITKLAELVPFSTDRMAGRVNSLRNAKKTAASLLSSKSFSKRSSVSSFILEKLPTKDLEGDYQVSIWAHG
jgi:hypothetical protein